MHSVRLADVIDPADIGVGDLPREPDFAEQPLEPRRILFENRGQELQGNGLSEFQVVRAVDFAHTPLAESANDPESSSEEHAGEEPPSLIRGRPGWGDGFSPPGQDPRDRPRWRHRKIVERPAADRAVVAAVGGAGAATRTTLHGRTVSQP